MICQVCGQDVDEKEFDKEDDENFACFSCRLKERWYQLTMEEKFKEYYQLILQNKHLIELLTDKR